MGINKINPRANISLKQKGPGGGGGGMAARRRKLNLTGVPGLNSDNKLDFIHKAADELMEKKIE